MNSQQSVIRVLTVVLLVCTSLQLSAITIYARMSADWDIAGTWSTVSRTGPSCGCTPAAGDDVIIDGREVDIDNGNETVNSIIITTNSGSAARLRIQNGYNLTVTTFLEVESGAGGVDAIFYIEDAGTVVSIGTDMILDGNGGDDIFVDIDQDGIVNIVDDLLIDQDGGDDINIRMNNNAGNSGQLNIGDDLDYDHDGGDDLNFLVDDASSLIDVGDDMIMDLNTGADDKVIFDLDNGTFRVNGNTTLNRADDTGQYDFDMDGGTFDSGPLDFTSAGALFNNGAIRFFVDVDSRLILASIDGTMTGGDDFYIHVNTNAGTLGDVDITGNLTINRTDGDDIDIELDGTGSTLDIDGNMTITTTGGEAFDIDLNSTGVMTVDGNLTINSTGGEDGEIDLNASGPTLNVGGNFTWTNGTGNLDEVMDLNGGTFAITGNCTLTNNAGADDIDIDLDGTAVMTVGGAFLATINGGDDIRIDLGTNVAGSTGSMTISGGASFIQNSAGAGSLWRLYVEEDTRFNVTGDLTLTTASTVPALHLMRLQNTAEASISNDIDMNAPGSGEIEIRLENTSWLHIGGSFLRDPAPNNFGELDCTTGTPTVHYNGTSVSQMFAEDAGGGGDQFYYYNVQITNTTATNPQLTMEGLATVHGNINFVDGVIASTATNILVIDNGATVSGASDASHVEGYVRKVGNTGGFTAGVGANNFEFPVGDNDTYVPLYINAPGAATDAFDAQYVQVNPHPTYDHTSLDASLDHISTCEYWFIDRAAGTNNVTPSLHYKTWDGSRPCSGVSVPAEVVVARWDGAVWRDDNNGGNSGAAANGSVRSGSAITAWGSPIPITLGTTTANNPLPIELVSFDATLNEDEVDLRWVTASELNNDFFTVERTKDGVTWEAVLVRDGAGTSSSMLTYSDVDPSPMLGTSYYRLAQTDFDLTTTHSDIVAVNYYPEGEIGVMIWPNPWDKSAAMNVEINGLEDEATLVIRDVVGREIYTKNIQPEAGVITIDPSGPLTPGTYLLSIISDDRVITKKVLIK